MPWPGQESPNQTERKTVFHDYNFFLSERTKRYERSQTGQFNPVLLISSMITNRVAGSLCLAIFTRALVILSVLSQGVG